VDLVLDEEVYERNQRSEEAASEIFPVLDRGCVGRAQRKAAGSPRDGEHKIGDHQNIVPIVVVSRRDIGPSSAGQCTNNARDGDRLWQSTAGFGCEEVPEPDEGEPGAWDGQSRLFAYEGAVPTHRM